MRQAKWVHNGMAIALVLIFGAGTRAIAGAWGPGPNFNDGNVVRGCGIFFPDNSRLYVMGGRSADTAGTDYTHPHEYDPVGNAWATKTATFSDNQVNNMACGVLNVGGTNYIFTVGGSAAGAATATNAVRAYDPVGDAFLGTAFDTWPGDASGTVLPGGFAVYNNMLYTIGGFNINVGMITDIWQFNPNGTPGSQWTQMVSLPVALGYVPATTIGTLIYTGGGSTYTGGTLVDSTDSYVFDPVGNTINTITAIPRATGETRAVNIAGQMWVLGGGRTAPNPSTEVDIYDPVGNSWTTGAPFATARRNFPADTDGTGFVYLVGGYAPSTPTNTMEIFNPTTCGTITLSPPTLPNGSVGTPYNAVVVASGGATPYTYAVTAGSLPPGVTLAPATGALSGTPTAGGLFSFTITATDNNGCTGSQAYSITITCPPFTFSPLILPDGAVGTAYSQTITVTGGTGPYTFAINGGALPPGLTLDAAAGTISGTPTDGSGSPYGFSLKATDSAGCFESHAYSIKILSVISISAQCGDSAGGVSVTITGSNFVTGDTLTIAGNAATGVTVVNSTQITATTPANSPGAVGDVVVNDPVSGLDASLTDGYGYDYLDVPSSNAFHTFVCAIERHRITGGCGGGNFCPSNSVVRSQMAVFLLVGEHGAGYTPPACTGIFSDVTCPSPFANWIEQLYHEGITGGCSTNPLDYCPSNAVSRAGMAVFLLVAEHGTGYTPPACTGIFSDVTCPSPFANWIEQLYNEHITGGCSTNPLMYCPGNSVNRAQMAVFLTATFALQ